MLRGREGYIRTLCILCSILLNLKLSWKIKFINFFKSWCLISTLIANNLWTAYRPRLSNFTKSRIATPYLTLFSFRKPYIFQFILNFHNLSMNIFSLSSSPHPWATPLLVEDGRRINQIMRFNQFEVGMNDWNFYEMRIVLIQTSKVYWGEFLKQGPLWAFGLLWVVTTTNPSHSSSHILSKVTRHLTFENILSEWPVRCY